MNNDPIVNMPMCIICANDNSHNNSNITISQPKSERSVFFPSFSSVGQWLFDVIIRQFFSVKPQGVEIFVILTEICILRGYQLLMGGEIDQTSYDHV